ncbi:efflux RND transporter periplasmic adaptor subunit [Kangiella koreensis]|uniref:Biotin/lipoyl attachment domain-containing protein n=1 Tax=Kangiella koreensis (strain DSM 16069 / JCM 12317 / KCTC 12182 / SW-125) TaxID=523791 RepID=C7RBQ2_KANKD|nr:HlyD family efflux transporter periplasmic adaptor subunit [Kangiella koreensis]ACV26694.1 biotin/lipoyl attachment domain-containing protein [Kangiella koreensis DSM 16069]
MHKFTIKAILISLLMLVSVGFTSEVAAFSGSSEVEEEVVEKGPHNGRMLRQDGFAIELSIFETGVPPEFRVWVTKDGDSVAPEQVDLNVKLTRLGGVVDDINFQPENDYLRGDMVIYEPHSFLVTVTANHQGTSYSWEYDNFEGRTEIADKVAQAMGIETGIAGPATLHQTIEVYGELKWPPGAQRQIKARFAGEIRKVYVDLGSSVKKGEVLMTIESNESLKPYSIRSPITGVVTDLFSNEGEQANAQVLLEVTTTDKLVAELAIYPTDRAKVKLNAPVELMISGFDTPVRSTIDSSLPQTRSDQAKLYRVKVDNTELGLSEGQFVTAKIEVNTLEVPLAVKRTGLQAFRDFTVVYAKVGEQYEVRMLELGEQDSEWVEVLGGLEPGTEYVTENSFIIKADIEKSGASHDH